MNVLLTFDVEIWCDSWETLDASFQRCFARYIYGHAAQGGFALPYTLEVLGRHNLKGIFFVEPLFAARFGLEYLKTIVAVIQDAGHEVQLHTHPEWANEITPLPVPTITKKRQFLFRYSLHEQTELIRLGLDLIQSADAPRPNAFRAGGFAANADTFSALRANEIPLDFSIDATSAVSVADLRDGRDLSSPQVIGGVVSVPIAVFRDGFGRHRHAQVGACSADEMIEAIEGAAHSGWANFVVLSHNFEMLKPDSSAPNTIVVDRFERLCDFLGQHRDRFVTRGVLGQSFHADVRQNRLPQVSRSATVRRYFEQAWQRLP